MAGRHAFHTSGIVYKIHNPYWLVRQGTACRYPASLAKYYLNLFYHIYLVINQFAYTYSCQEYQ